MFPQASPHNSIIGTLPPTPAPPKGDAARSMTAAELRALVASRRGVSVLSDAELSALLTTSREALVTVAREDINVFAALVLRDERTGKRVEQAPVHRAMHGFLDARTPTGELKHPRAVVWGHVEAGKAVPLDTEIPTPAGWTTMGALQPGDMVFGSDGKPCTVLAVSPVQYDREVYRLTFDDGATALADADHQWTAWTMDDRAGHKPPRVVTTREMLARGVKLGTPGCERFRWTLPLASAVHYPAQELPIDPYVLGAWLGDGSTNGTVLTFHLDDRAVYDECRRLEPEGSGRLTPSTRNPLVVRASLGGTGGTFTKRLRALGVFGRKHVPELYLRASIEQRTRLLMGLLDTDGCIEGRGDKSRVEFCGVNKELCTGVLELVRSLGFKATMYESDAKIYGRVVSKRYRLAFTARSPVFFLPRKLAHQKLDGRRMTHRTLTAIEPVPSVPVKCITVSSPDSTYLMGRDYVVTHNTQSVVIARVLFMLGHDPTLRIVIASKVATRAAYIVTSIAAYIENSDDLHAVFPALRKGPLWRLDALRIQGAGYATDPSVRAMGVGTTTLGSRVDVFIGDDIIDMESTRTPYLRQQTVDWFFGVIEGRLTADARVYIIGNAWHPEDAMHRLAATDGWASRRFPVLDERTGALSWPARWPRSRIDKKRRGMPPTEFARAYLCKARADEDARFARRDIERAMERGRGLIIGPDRAHWRPGIADHVRRACRFYTGVDLAVSQRKKADRTALVTLAVWPDGTREVVDIQTGRWNAAEILRRIVRVTQAWGSIACIENVAAQDWMRQFAEIARVKTVAYSTGTSQPPLDFQAEQLAAEFAQGRWVIPMGAGGELDAEVSAWVNALLYYVPARHTPDVMAASLFAMHAAGSADSMDATGVEDAVRAVLTAAVGSAEGAPRRDVWG